MVNAPLIKKYTGIDNYIGRLDQIQEIMKSVNKDNYRDMYIRVGNLESNDSIIGNSNFGKFIRLFESDDNSWIKRINDSIE